MYKWDDIWYDTEAAYNAAIASYGSIRVYAVDGLIRRYTLLAADSANLPTHEKVGAGSSAIAVDTLAVYLYDVTTKTWHTHA